MEHNSVEVSSANSFKETRKKQKSDFTDCVASAPLTAAAVAMRGFQNELVYISKL
jgi:hypothetical protein